MNNCHGVDVDYFKKELSRVRGMLRNRTPSEIHKYLLDLAEIARPKEDEETEKIHSSIKFFANEMEERMIQKKNEGRTGWDNISFKHRIKDGLMYQILKQTKTGNEEVDIANFSMMLYFLKDIPSVLLT